MPIWMAKRVFRVRSLDMSRVRSPTYSITFTLVFRLSMDYVEIDRIAETHPFAITPISSTPERILRLTRPSQSPPSLHSPHSFNPSCSLREDRPDLGSNSGGDFFS